MGNVIIGVGNCGNNNIKNAAKACMNEVKMYSIDSQLNIDLDSVNPIIKYIPIVADDKCGSGRNRERGAAMYKYHEDQGLFDEMYKDCAEAKSPVIVIVSGGGGTGSGSAKPLCDKLISMGVQVIVIMVFPRMEDPAAYHLNTTDLMLELGQIGVDTYAVFRNQKDDPSFTNVNDSITDMIKIFFGKKNKKTDLEDIDDSDLDTILSYPGRIIAFSAEGNDVESLKQELTRKLLSGIQPAWGEDIENITLMSAYSLSGPYADKEYDNVFSDINAKIPTLYDNFKNIAVDTSTGKYEASIIIAGLPRPDIKEISGEFKEAGGISDGIKTSTRPKALTKKKAIIPSSGEKKPFQWI